MRGHIVYFPQSSALTGERKYFKQQIQPQKYLINVQVAVFLLDLFCCHFD